MKKGIFYTLAVLLFYSSCIEKPVYPSKPVIKYVNFLRYGSNPLDPTAVELVVSFTDNEGDIGLSQADTQSVFKYGNVWLEYYYDSANTGVWAAFDSSITTPKFDTFRFAYRVPPVLPPGDPSEPMKGLIYVKQQPFIKVHDRIKYVVYMYDKAGHKSDTIQTPSISFK